jgi:hypothetical protein
MKGGALTSTSLPPHWEARADQAPEEAVSLAPCPRCSKEELDQKRRGVVPGVIRSSQGTQQ